MKPLCRAIRFSLVVFIFNGVAVRSEDKKETKYVFYPYTERVVGICRGEWVLTGKLDINGDFEQEGKRPRFGRSTIGLPYALITPTIDAPLKMYEYRSGMLIPGELQRDGRFIPKVGGKIIPLKDYVYSPTATKIWNLPGAFVPEEEAKKYPPKKPEEKK